MAGRLRWTGGVVSLLAVIVIVALFAASDRRVDRGPPAATSREPVRPRPDAESPAREATVDRPSPAGAETHEVRISDRHGLPVDVAEVVVAGHVFRTDATGRAQVTRPPTGGVTLRVAADGFLPRTVTIDVGEPQPTDVTLLRPVVVRGTVVDAGGASVAASLRISPLPASWDGIDVRSDFEAPEGRFSTTLPEDEGWTRFIANVPDGRTGSAVRGPRDRGDVRIVVAPSGPCVVRVVDGATGEQRPDVCVFAERRDGVADLVSTDSGAVPVPAVTVFRPCADGTHTAMLAAGAVVVHVASSRHGGASVEFVHDPGRTDAVSLVVRLPVVSSEACRIVSTARPAGVRGTATFLPAAVTAFGPRLDHVLATLGESAVRIETDPFGAFRASLASGWSLWVEAEEHAVARVEGPARADGERRIELDPRIVRWLRLRVVDEDGTGVRGAGVRVDGVQHRAGADGRLVFRTDAPRPAVLVAATGFLARRVALSGEATSDELVVALRRAVPFQVQVQDRTGGAAAGMRLRVDDVDATSSAVIPLARTGVDGKASCLAPAGSRVRIGTVDGERAWRGEIETGPVEAGEVVVLTVERLRVGTLHGVVHVPPGVAIGLVTVTAVPRDGGAARVAIVRPGEHVEFDGLPAGVWEVASTAVGGAFVAAPVELRIEPHATETFALQLGRSLAALGPKAPLAVRLEDDADVDVAWISVEGWGCAPLRRKDGLWTASVPSGGTVAVWLACTARRKAFVWVGPHDETGAVIGGRLEECGVASVPDIGAAERVTVRESGGAMVFSRRPADLPKGPSGRPALYLPKGHYDVQVDEASGPRDAVRLRVD